MVLLGLKCPNCFAGTELANLPGYPPNITSITGKLSEAECVNSQVAPCNAVTAGWTLYISAQDMSNLAHNMK